MPKVDLSRVEIVCPILLFLLKANLISEGIVNLQSPETKCYDILNDIIASYIVQPFNVLLFSLFCRNAFYCHRKLFRQVRFRLNIFQETQNIFSLTLSQSNKEIAIITTALKTLIITPFKSGVFTNPVNELKYNLFY